MVECLTKLRTLRAVTAGLALLLLVFVAAGTTSAQSDTEGTATEAEKEAEAGGSVETPDNSRLDGYDRPTTYPRIRFSPKREEDETAARARRSRVYLLDISHAMSASITIDGTKETTRIEHMAELVERSLESLARRRGVYFNLVTFGTVQDLAAGGEVIEANAESTQRAIKWLRELEAKGDADIYGMLKAMYEQKPDSAVMLVGGMPARPVEVDEEEFAKHENVGEYLIAAVRRWRAESQTALDITGIGLDAEARAYYRRLAQAGGGTYLDG